MSSTRRGRPPGRLVDPTPSEGAAFSCEVRIGWLLRGWRLAARPDSSARSFAGVLTDLGQSADASRVSRWETGQLAAPLDVIGTYEHALGVVPGSLAALALGTRRMPSGQGEPLIGLPVHRFSVPDLERTLDLVVDGEPTGSDWFEFALLVASRPEQVTLATSTWHRITAALVKQLGLSVSHAYLTRSEAAVLLSRHPRGKRALLRSIGEYVMNPESLLVVDQLSLLTDMSDPAATDLVLRLLEQQPPGPTLNGALWAASAKVTRGHFGPDEVARLERAVRGIAHRIGWDAGGIFTRLSDLVAVLPEEARLGLAPVTGLTTPIGEGQAARTWPRPQVRRVTAQVAGAPGDEDPLLERLLEEAIFHANAERRFHSALMVTFSPHRARLGHSCSAVLQRHVDGTEPLDPLLAERLMVLMTFVATPDERPLLRRIIEEGPTELSSAALVAAAHLPPSPEHPSLRHLLASGDEEAIQRVLYYAGMTGAPALLEIETDSAVPQWMRKSAAWWRQEGPALHEPARQRMPRPPLLPGP